MDGEVGDTIILKNVVMAKKIQLSIPEPCHEKWNEMTPVDKGRFCGSCQKKVVDFTTMSDREVAMFFKRPSTGSVCGRFMNDQLDRNLSIPKKRIPWFKYFFQFALPAFFASTKVVAQGEVKARVDTVVNCTNSPEKRGEVAVVEAQHSTRDSIRGRIVDVQGLPLPNATVRLKGTNMGAASDNDGAFIIRGLEPAKDWTLQVSYVGYESIEVKVDQKSAKDSQYVVLATLSPSLMGDVVVIVGMISPRKTKPAPLIAPVEDRAFRHVKVFPNPVVAGGELTIDRKKQEEGYYDIELLTTAGQSVHRKEVWLDADARILSVAVPVVRPGVYFVKVGSRKTGKFFSERIIVE